MDNIFWQTFISSSIISIECSIIGVYIFLLDIPFIGVTIAHSSMAGGIWGIIFKIPEKVSAFLFAILSIFLLEPISKLGRIKLNISLSIIFSVFMGIIFLGMSFINDNFLIKQFLWGNIFLIEKSDILISLFLLVFLIGFSIIFYNKYILLFFDKEIALSMGIKNNLYYLILIVAGGVVSINLNIIGGLLLFGFIIIPAAISYQITDDLKKMFLLSCIIGFLSNLIGLIISFLLNLPVSSTIVTFMGIVFMITVGLKRLVLKWLNHE